MPYPPNDGGAIATLNMIKGFVNRADSVTVLAMQTYKHPLSISELPKNISKSINWHQVKVNTRLNPFLALANILFSTKPYNAVRFESKAFGKKLEQLLLSHNFDIVQLEGLYLYSYENAIRKHSNAKIVLRAHNIEHEIWQRLAKNATSPPKRFYLNLLAKRVMRLEFELLKKVDLLVPITRRDADVLQIADAGKVMVSPTGIEESKFELSSPKYHKSLFYIGALDWSPNQEALMWFLDQVWVNVKKEFENWEFVIAGRNAPPSFVSDLKKYPVKYIGEVGSATQFIDEHNIMVVPLLSGSGMRIKIIEGMARGKCILTTKIGAEGIPAKNGHSIYIQNTAHEFINVLNKLMQNSNQINECGKNAFIFVRNNYNNNVIVNKLREFYIKHINNA